MSDKTYVKTAKTLPELGKKMDRLKALERKVISDARRRASGS